MLQRVFTEEQIIFLSAAHLSWNLTADYVKERKAFGKPLAAFPISRQYTDAKVSTIYASSSEIMKMIISRECLSDEYLPFNTRNF